MATNFIEVVTEAVKAVGTSDADWRVQAAAAALLITSGIGLLRLEKIRGRIGKWKDRKNEQSNNP